MRKQDKLSASNVVLYFCGIVPVVWGALLTAPALSGGLPEILKNLTVSLENPFNISIMQDTPKCILFFLLAYAMGIGIYLSTAKNYRHREEHGSAKWGNLLSLIHI